MKLDVQVNLKMNGKAVSEAVQNAARLAMRDTVVAVHGDSIRNAKAVGAWKTGTNARSLTGIVSGMGVVADGGEGREERLVDDNKIEGAVYSTSEYGGFIETGTFKMPARPYIVPALHKNFTQEKFSERMKGYVEK